MITLAWTAREPRVTRAAARPPPREAASARIPLTYIQLMPTSGSSVLEDALGELAPGRLFLLTGGPGSGKSTLCLQFLAHGLARGESVALLTTSRGEDVKSLARHLGLDANAAIRARRLLVLRYRTALVRQLGHVAAMERVIDDLRELLRGSRATRIAVDSCAPFLADGAAAGLGLALLGECLDGIGATSILTYPERLDDAYDRRLEPIVQRASALVHLRRRSGGLELETVSRRDALAPRRLLLAVHPGQGLAPSSDVTLGEDFVVDHTPKPLLLVHTTSEPSDELVALLDRGHQVIIESAAQLAHADYLARGEFGAIVVETDHRTLSMAQRLMARLGAEPSASPLVAVARFTIRSLDRARLLGAGADEVLTGEMGPDEFVQRLRAVVRRGHLSRSMASIGEVPGLTHAMLTGGDRRPLDPSEMARVVNALTGTDDIVPCAVVTLTLTESAALGGTRALADVSMHAMRFASGDFAMATEDSVVVCLVGAQRRGAGAFVDRLRERWASSHEGALRADVLTLPAQAAEARALLPEVEV